MIAVSDTSPLSYFVAIGEAELLSRLYERVLIPQAVARECLVRQWILRPPEWLEVTAEPSAGRMSY